MEILEHIDLLPYNTFNISCTARFFVIVKSTKDFQELIETDIFKENPRLILGGGSNILLTQDTYDGLVIKNEIKGKQVLFEDDQRAIIRV